MMNHDNRRYSFLRLRYCSSVAKEMFILGLSLDSPHFFQLLAKQCFKHWTYRSLFVSLIILVTCFQFQLPVLVHNPYLIPKWLHFNCKWKKRKAGRAVKGILILYHPIFRKTLPVFIRVLQVVTFRNLVVTWKERAFRFNVFTLWREKMPFFFSEVWAQKYSFKY